MKKTPITEKECAAVNRVVRDLGRLQNTVQTKLRHASLEGLQYFLEMQVDEMIGGVEAFLRSCRKI